MPKFVFAYHGGASDLSPEEGQALMAEWMMWIESMGEAVVDRGLAVGPSKTAGPEGIVDNGGANPLSGYSVIETTNLDMALQLAAASPHIKIGGTIEVAPALDIPM